MVDLRIDEMLASVRDAWPHDCQAGLILGTGSGGVAGAIEIEAAIDFDNIPHFPLSTALGHKGRLVCGRLGGAAVMAMEGRVHLYEGYSFDEVTLGVRLMHAAGAGRLIVSNAAGGLNPRLTVGDVVVLTDHIAMIGRPLPILGTRDDRARPPGPYDQRLIDRALATARREGFSAMPGVYVGVSGPNYETRAEYRLFRKIGGDVVGMSTVPEVIAAAVLGLPVLGLSIVTNVARPDAPETTDPREVLWAAKRAEPKLRGIVESCIS